MIDSWLSFDEVSRRNQSGEKALTFIGERHQLCLRILGPQADAIASRLLDGLEEAEFVLRGHIVADIALAAPPLTCSDGSIEVKLEALTLVDA
ncbi:hypothetical protein [Sphingomicrobium marinum]|uniref:hypothetical protein n=1 Tax=Sphingomicrobium marinum TaxID=1227950 RepID=UPI00223FE0AD|nr:hypothetical protein [Sphingomicrobium marinum]